MGQYIFTAPKVAYDTKLTYADALEYINKGMTKRSRKLGTTVTVEIPDYATEIIQVRLYETVIAVLRPEDHHVHISSQINDFGSYATTWWVQKVLSDNGHSGWVARLDFKYAQAGEIFTR